MSRAFIISLLWEIRQDSIHKIEQALNAEIAKITGATERGLTEAAIQMKALIKLDVPVSTNDRQLSNTNVGGALRDSFHIEDVIEPSRITKKFIFDVVSPRGFHYSWATHDNPNAGAGGPDSYPYKSVVGQPEFLTRAFEENREMILFVISEFARRR